jgi:hypothetical protein
MKRILTALSLFAILFAVNAMAQPQVRLGLSFGDAPRANRFYVELTNRYDVPYEQVCFVRDAGLPDEDIPDVLYIYTHSDYSLRHIINLRLRGATWNELYTWCGIPQDIYYRPAVPVYRTGPPYGNAWGYYRNHRAPVYRDYDRDDHDRGYDEGRGYGNGRGHGNGKHKGWKND